MLCGISSRFQLLSPSERQVAHALLTRPPLSITRKSFSKLISIQRNNFVRLACVRHAASVRPEPGSNSLLNGINTSFYKDELIFFNRQAFLAHLFNAMRLFRICPDTVLFSRFYSQINLLGPYTLFNFQGTVFALVQRLSSTFPVPSF